MKRPTGFAFVAMATVGFGLLTHSATAADAKLDEELQSIVNTGVVPANNAAKTATVAPATTAPSQAPAFGQRPSTAHSDSSGRVQIDIEYDCTATNIEQLLKATGFTQNSIVKIAPLCVAEGWIAPSSLISVTAIPTVIKVRVPIYAAPRTTPPVQPLPLHK